MKTNTLIRPSTINIKASTLKVSVFFSPTQLILCTSSMEFHTFNSPSPTSYSPASSSPLRRRIVRLLYESPPPPPDGVVLRRSRDSRRRFSPGGQVRLPEIGSDSAPGRGAQVRRRFDGGRVHASARGVRHFLRPGEARGVRQFSVRTATWILVTPPWRRS